MSFHVWQRNEFVQSDISESLTGAFREPRVFVYNVFEALLEAVLAATDPIVAIISKPDDEALQKMRDLVKDGRARVIVTSEPDNREVFSDDAFHFLPLPFSSPMLINAVRSATSDLPSFPR